jgi:hypothetical protein
LGSISTSKKGLVDWWIQAPRLRCDQVQQARRVWSIGGFQVVDCLAIKLNKQEVFG